MPIAPVGCPYVAVQYCATVAVSNNNGQSWQARLMPALLGSPSPLMHSQDAGVFADHRAGAAGVVMYVASNGAPYQAERSNSGFITPDNGVHWFYTPLCCGPAENPRVAFGAPPKGQPTPTGYPNVIYYCANVPYPGDGLPTNVRTCIKSMDGGKSFGLKDISIILNPALPVHPECGTNGEEVAPLDGNYPQAGPDGSLYLLVHCVLGNGLAQMEGKAFLGVSRDEARTFPTLHHNDKPVEIPYARELRVDGKGNLFLFGTAKTAQGGTHVMMWTSTNKGVAWRGPVDLTAPGVFNIGAWYPAVSQQGQAGVAYYGQHQGQQTSDGYLTRSDNPLAPAPLFLSGMVNRADDPLLYPNFGGGIILNDFNGADMGPDGSLWGSFLKMCSSQTNPACVDPVDRPGNTNVGYAARLVPVG